MASDGYSPSLSFGLLTGEDFTDFLTCPQNEHYRFLYYLFLKGRGTETCWALTSYGPGAAGRDLQVLHPNPAATHPPSEGAGKGTSCPLAAEGKHTLSHPK